MPDLQQFAVTRLAPATLTVPRWRIEFQVTDERTGAVLRDFTGANALTFPNLLGTLSNAQQDAWVQQVVMATILARLDNA